MHFKRQNVVLQDSTGRRCALIYMRSKQDQCPHHISLSMLHRFLSCYEGTSQKLMIMKEKISSEKQFIVPKCFVDAAGE